MNNVKDRSNFCPIPFLQLQLNPVGNVSACCFSGEHKVGDILTDTIQNIWNGNEIQKWRSEFINDEIKICKSAMKNFECHKMFKHLNALVDNVSTVQSSLPKRLDIRLNGKCNLECVMCDVWKQPNGLYDKSDFWEIGPEKIFPFLIEVDLLGGEPFIQKDTFRFIEEVSKVNSKCTWAFVTNASYVFSDYLENILNKILIRSIHISLDGMTKDTYEKIRIKGNFEKTFNTVRRYLEYRKERFALGKGFVLFSSMCVQRDNYHEIGLFLDFCKENEIQPVLQSVIGRDHLSLSKLKRSQLVAIQDSLKPYLETENRFSVLPVYEDVAKFLKQYEEII